jgi:cell division protein FtsN
MDGNYHTQTQFELFPSAGRATSTRPQSRLFNSPLTFSMENFIILTIVIVMSMVLSFSFGVERGKNNELPAVAAKAIAQPVAPVALKDKPPLPAEVPESKEKVDLSETKESLSKEVRVFASLNEPVAAEEKTVDNVYTIQVASYKIGDYAKKEATSLKQKGYDSMVLTKGQHEIVCIGKFAAMKEAKKFSQKLKKQYKDCLVRRM